MRPPSPAWRRPARQRPAAGPAVPPQHKARPENHAALRRQQPRLKRTLPRRRHLRSQTDAVRRVLRAHGLRRVAVNVCRAHLHPHRRPSRLAHRVTQHPRAFQARAEDFVLMIGRLDAVHAAARQVDQPARSFQRPPPVPQRATVPGDMLPRTGRSRRPPRKHHRRHPLLRQMPRERHPQKPAASRNDNPVGSSRQAHGADPGKERWHNHRKTRKRLTPTPQPF